MAQDIEASIKTMTLLAEKKGIIMGVANDHSIAWGISKLASEWGADMVFSYQNVLLKKRVATLAESIGCMDAVVECDVSKEGQVKQLMDFAAKKFGKIDFIVHSMAYSDKKELQGAYYNTSRKNFLNAMDISVYSFTETCREAMPILNGGASLITLTYLGSQRVLPNYNVMGVAKAALEASTRYLAADMGAYNIRVNAVSPGPIKTMAASVIGDFDKMLQSGEKASPIHRRVTIEDVGGLACFLMTDYAAAITGGVHYVDAGYNIMGMSEEL
jgi:enoyl-[acyl-carrier protein] reductase I